MQNEMMAMKRDVKGNEEKPLFQLFFLKDDEDRSVEIQEVEEIDFREVEKRLEQGESVFIKPKSKQENIRTVGSRGANLRH